MWCFVCEAWPALHDYCKGEKPECQPGYYLSLSARYRAPELPLPIGQMLDKPDNNKNSRNECQIPPPSEACGTIETPD